MKVKEVLSVMVSLATVVSGGGFSYVEPTVGEPWPLPQAWLKELGYVDVDASIFGFNITDYSCQILQDALGRYASLIHTMGSSAFKSESKAANGTFTLLYVSLMSDCEDMPYLYMSEEYELKICTSGYPDKAQLISNSIWGILRGLETFSHLLMENFATGEVSINCAQILDFPRFSHRGLLLDTSRHFLPLSSIMENLELMAMNKLNTFHWHMVDDQSFPYQSDVFPDLSGKGSWTDSQVYSDADIQSVIAYARDRGIRVIAEFDTPGHVRSWGEGQPGLLTECYSGGEPDGTFGPVDPSNENNYVFLDNLFTEVTQRFSDHYVHLGGDEVPFSCWQSNPAITDFMASLNISGDYVALESYYIQRLLNIVQNFTTQNGYIIWEEVVDNGVVVANDTLVHIWKYREDPDKYYDELASVTAMGYQVLFSSCWYLNDIEYGVDWHRYYTCDPHNFEGTQEQYALVKGGEIAMWGEWVDRTNLVPRLWPRASPAAERLWSDPGQTSDVDQAEPRLEEHRCRLLRRGHAVEPLGPSYCEGVI